MKVAVYNQFWATAGGGEKVAGGIAEALASVSDVTLLSHEELDLEDLGERLQLDLRGLQVRLIDQSAASVEEASADFDVFVNTTYHSSAHNAAPHGVYYVHFPHAPTRPAVGLRGAVAERLVPLVQMPDVTVELLRGFHPEELVARRAVRWTDGQAVLRIRVPPGRVVPVRLDLARLQPKEIGPISVRVEVDGEERASVEVTPRLRRLGERALVPVPLQVRAQDGARHVDVRILSPAFVPARALGADDTRRLGVLVAGVQVGGPVRAALGRQWPALARPTASISWLDSYQELLVNSSYTRPWVQRWWHRDPELLYPPVTLQPRREKRQMILNVGRFFDADSGHSKKQLELVQAFRTLCDRGLTGWELHLVGGCSRQDRAYLERVRHHAGDLPVHLHVNAPGAELRQLYGEARLYWHASGLGEDPERHPDRFEHFGITTVEAMSAGAVPIVIGSAGQAEVVDDGRTGLHFHSVDELVTQTERVVASPEMEEQLSTAAEAEARRYGWEPFAERVRAIVSRVAAEPAGRR